MTIKDVRDDLYRKLDIETSAAAPLYIREDVAQAINSALQTMRMAGPDYFTAEWIDVALSGGTAAYVLDQDVQRVEGPVRTSSGLILRPLNSRTSYDTFNQTVLGNTAASGDQGTPLAYYVENEAQREDDSVKITLLIAPTPDTSYTLKVNVTKEPPRIAGEDFCDDPLPTLPVPHQYVETLFLPIARYHVTRSHWFKSKDSEARLQADYETALVALGLASPDTNPVRHSRRSFEETEVGK